MSGTRPVVIEPGAGEDIWFGGGRVTLKITSEQSGGLHAVIEDRMPRGKTTPLHLHRTFDETIFVLEGELLVHVDGTDHNVVAGGLASLPRGFAHALLVTSEEARVLAVATPGDVFERFLREAGDVPTSASDAPPPLDIEKVASAGARTGAMEVLGPPPFDLASIHR